MSDDDLKEKEVNDDDVLLDMDSGLDEKSMWEVVNNYISEGERHSDQAIAGLKYKLRTCGLDRALEALTEYHLRSDVLRIDEDKWDEKTNNALGLIHALNELWEYIKRHAKIKTNEEENEYNRRYGIELKYGAMPQAYVEYANKPQTKEWLDIYKIGDIPLWRAERVENFENGNIDCYPNWLRFVCLFQKITGLREEGDIAKMTAPKKDRTREAILRTRKQSLLDRARKQIAILEQYQKTKKYNKAIMNNNWLLFDNDKITVIPRIGGYPVTRAVKDGKIQEGGVGWPCEDVNEAINKVNGFILNLQSSMYDDHILHMFDSIKRKQTRLDKMTKEASAVKPK